MSAVLEAVDVRVERSGRAEPLLDGVALRVNEGELIALVGPNGAGKSTLLHVLAGDLVPTRGEVLLHGEPLRRVQAAAASRLRAVMTQDNDVLFPFRVAEVVEMGRAPWRGRAEAADDDDAIADALASAEIAHLADRPVPGLSGGERARTALARLLAQRCRIQLLDEPTASLDVRHQERTLAGLRGRTEGGGAAVVVLHDLDLAAAYATRVVVLEAGRIRADGAPAAALDASLLEDVYRHPFEVERTPGGLRVRPVRVLLPTPSDHAEETRVRI